MPGHGLLVYALAVLIALAPLQRASAAESPWKIKITFQGCYLGDPNVGDCTTRGWVYDRTTSEVYLCEGRMTSRIGVEPSVSALCHKALFPGTSGVELAAGEPYVTPWDKNWYNNTLGFYDNYVWIIGQLITDLRICHRYSTAELICSGQPTIGSPINVKSAVAEDASKK